MKHLTKITDLTSQEIIQIINLALNYKKEFDQSIPHKPILTGKYISLIFEKPSLRTRVSFEVATKSLGGHAIFLTSENILSRGKEKGRESIPDITKNLERFTDCIFARVYSHQTIDILSQTSQIPVINGLCDKHHPTQTLADLMTIYLFKKSFKNLKVTFIGDGCNVPASLMLGCALLGINFTIATPKGYELDASLVQEAQNISKQTNSNLEFLTDPQKASEQADIIYTDTWISMGAEEETQKRLKSFQGYQVNSSLMNLAKKDAMFLHCLPAHRGEEVTNQVMDSSNSKVFDQAECRLHTAKAVLNYLLT